MTTRHFDAALRQADITDIGTWLIDGCEPKLVEIIREGVDLHEFCSTMSLALDEEICFEVEPQQIVWSQTSLTQIVDTTLVGIERTTIWRAVAGSPISMFNSYRVVDALDLFITCARGER